MRCGIDRKKHQLPQSIEVVVCLQTFLHIANHPSRKHNSDICSELYLPTLVILLKM